MAMSITKRVSLAVIALALVILVAVAVWACLLLYSPAGPGTALVNFTIVKGEKLENISSRLHKAGLLKDPVALKLAAFLHGGGEAIKAGNHEIPGNITAVELLTILQQSPQKDFRVLTIPEGWDSFEIATKLAEEQFATEEEILRLVSDPDLLSMIPAGAASLEGYLYPDTYHVPVDATPRDILTMMIKRWHTFMNADIEQRFESLGLTLQEGITLASLIAKEAGNEEEMPLISSVFHNRLERGMLLQCDPTFIYAAKLEEVWDGIAHRSDIDREHAYNTYLEAGLPPGPIGNPGEAAIMAACAPAESNYLFFVAKSGDQSEGHYFARTNREHERNVSRYRRALQEEKAE